MRTYLNSPGSLFIFLYIRKTGKITIGDKINEYINDGTIIVKTEIKPDLPKR